MEEALIGVEVISSRSRELLVDTVRALKLALKEVRLSSVYKVHHSSDDALRGAKIEKSFDVLCIAVRAISNLEPEKLNLTLKRLNISRGRDAARHRLNVVFLAYGERCQMSPELTLPHIELHLRPEYIVPSAEIWPDFMHPILQEPLSQIVKKQSLADWGEFYSQGKTLLDF